MITQRSGGVGVVVHGCRGRPLGGGLDAVGEEVVGELLAGHFGYLVA